MAPLASKTKAQQSSLHQQPHTKEFEIRRCEECPFHCAQAPGLDYCTKMLDGPMICRYGNTPPIKCPLRKTIVVIKLKVK